MLYKEEAFGFEEKTEVFSLLVSLFEVAVKNVFIIQIIAAFFGI